MALLKTPLYLFTRFLAGPPEPLPASTVCVLGGQRGEHSLSAGALLSFPRCGLASPAAGKRREKPLPGNNGERLERRQPRTLCLRPRSRRFLRPRSPFCWGAPAPLTAGPRRPLPRYRRQPAPLTGDPRSPLASPPAQRRAADGALGFTPSAAHPQTLPPTAPSVLEGKWGCAPGPPPVRLPSLSRGRRSGQVGLWEPSPLRRMPPTSRHRSLACREHYPPESRQHYRRAPAGLQCAALPFRGRCCTQKPAQHCSPP